MGRGREGREGKGVNFCAAVVGYIVMGNGHAATNLDNV
jgi:hypothetical protein